MEPSAWHVWILVGLAFGALELKLGNFVMVWFGLGSLFTAGAAALGLSLNAQLVLFTAASLALFLASRTVFRSVFVRNTRTLRHGAEAMVGADAVVVEPLPERGFGTVRIFGELWQARSLEGRVAKGEFVRIESLNGLRLNVRKASEGAVTKGESQ